MKILITGGAGYIGSVLVPMLLDEGHDVTVLDRFIYGDSSLAACVRYPNFHPFRVDVRDYGSVKPYLKDADAIIPLAALVGAPLCELNPVDAELVNRQALLWLFNEIPNNDQTIIMPTTESVYGTNAEVCTEETECAPLSKYGRDKLEVETALLERDRAVSLRLATVFGFSPRMRLDLLINDFTWRALKDRSISVFEAAYRRTSVHVRDVAAAFLHTLEMKDYSTEGGKFVERTRSGIYNVGAVHCTKLELCNAIQRQVPHFSYVVMGTPPKDSFGRDPDQRNYIVSDAKIRSTGFDPLMTLDAGISELLKGYEMLSNNRHGNVP